MQLSETNPGSHVVLETDNNQKFVRLFIAFGACIHGFNYCRPLLFMDATHLRSKYLGHLMAATGLIGNNGIYPLAYDVVSAETDANWKWFMEHLRDVVSPQRQLTFVSDRGSGLVNQIPVVFPGAYHGWCYWHMTNNVHACLPKSAKTYNNYVLNLFEKCAYANTHVEFKESWDKLMLVKNQKLQDYLSRNPVDKLVSFFFPGCRYGEMCSNVAECLNVWIKEERDMPIAVMFDKIGPKLMEMMCTRHEESATSFVWRGVLCLKMETELYNNKMHGRDYNVTKSSEFVYEVHASLTQRVDLKEKTCSCNRWKINGFPCAHVVRCITGNEEDPYKYFEHYFTTKSY
ncbi:protein FAR-RED ELONGATED HYPOCOTYL 3-like [Papaver somniferum]|uniref:protein FAR-RED ELONGATED HYPOCOTYL 3-like n=1 Tax=Papaver somniferum TaxID=3469 RepID=UPI000E6FCC74|nr:protein FAR-RED ELONGATED HYPOCOTYL 3-like [Papaver somniferum]